VRQSAVDSARGSCPCNESNGQEENGDRGKDEQQTQRNPQQSEFVQCTLQRKGNLGSRDRLVDLSSDFNRSRPASLSFKLDSKI